MTEPVPEMVERVARAIAPKLWEMIDRYQDDDDWNWSTALNAKDGSLRDARAAIAAMREPTPDMVTALGEQFYWGGCPTCGGLAGGYKRLIDAALGRKP